LLACAWRCLRAITVEGTFIGVALWLILPTATAAQVSEAGLKLWGQPVLDVRLSCDARLTLSDFPGAVSQEVDQPLDPSKTAVSLKKLYATGRFTELRAEAEPGPGGVHLLFVGRAQYFIGVVQVEGTPSGLEPRVLLTSTRLRLGQLVSDDILIAAQKHISEILASSGYYRATVRYRLLPDPATQEAEAIFSILPGKPARLSSVEFQGDPGFAPAKLAKVAGWRHGIQLTSAHVERGSFRLHQFFVSRNRLQATVSVLKREYDTKLNTEKLLVRVETGPLVRVRVEGAKIPSSKLKTLLPVYRDGVVDEPALAHSDRLLEDYLQQLGYFSAAVKAEQAFHAESQTLALTFRVNRGKRGQFEGYGFEGNRAIPTAELMAAMSPSARGVFSPAPLYSHTLLESKANTLTALYQSKGFLDVRISPRVDDHFWNQAGHRFVTFKVEEGLQTSVHQLAFTGVSRDVQKALWPSLLSKPSHPYSPGRAAADRDTISNYLAKLGYAQAEVTWHASPINEQHQVDLDFRIELGRQERIRRIVVLGNEHTRLGVIRRELVIHPGQPLSQDNVADSQRRLYELGMFRQVQIATQDQPSSETEKSVLVAVEESRRWTLGYGGGLEVQRLGSNNPQGTFKASPRISLDLNRLDVGGRDQTFTLWGRLSYIDTGAGTSYVIPYFANRRDLNLRLNGLVDRSRDVLTFTDDRKEASVTVEKRFSAATAISARYSFSRVEALDLSGRISPDEQKLLKGPTWVGGFGGSYVNDHRDEPLDATRGSYSLADAGIMYKGFGSQANFLRLTGQYATYHQLSSHLVFARNTRFGFESPYGSPEKILVSAPGQPKQYAYTDSLPLPERLFMGGSDSHRGFSINQAGPRDRTSGYPIGGNALFFNSFELRARMAQQRLGFVLFNDTGNVFTTIRRMRLLQFSQTRPLTKIDTLDYDSEALGIGLRYKTPVGPLSFDVGYNLNPPRYQMVTTNGIVEVQQLARFQFFLSFGQSF
jgi:outer membrane protein assembly complex protein YaeT